MFWKSVFDFARVYRAGIYSLQGLRASMVNEPAFRQEIVLSFILVPLGCWLGESGTERALLVGSWLIVPLVELINSSIESIVDRIGAERHELSGRAKDQGSAAVLLALILAAIVWFSVLWG